jgi:hypothetical protein
MNENEVNIGFINCRGGGASVNNTRIKVNLTINVNADGIKAIFDQKHQKLSIQERRLLAAVIMNLLTDEVIDEIKNERRWDSVSPLPSMSEANRRTELDGSADQ